MKWISIKEETPVNGQQVLILFRYTRYPDKDCISMGRRDFDGWRLHSYDITPDAKVLYTKEYLIDNDISIKYWAEVYSPTEIEKIKISKISDSNRLEILDLEE